MICFFLRYLCLALELVLLSFGCIAERAHAQAAAPWLVIPAATATEAAQNSVEVTRAAIVRELQRSGEPVLATGVVSLVEQRHSTALATLSRADEERLRAALAAGRQELALERLPEARAALEPVDRLSDAELDQLRQTQAQWMFETCVMRAWLVQQGAKSKRAQELMQGCIQTYPGFESPTHPHILRLFEQTRAQMQFGSVDVRAPAGCKVRMFGIEVGRSPIVLQRVAVGPTPVQVECPGQSLSRRHVVHVNGASAAVVEIVPRFDAVLRTERGEVQLVYSDARSRLEYLAADARAIAQILGVRMTALVPGDVSARGSVFSVSAPAAENAGMGELHYIEGSGVSADELSRVVRALTSTAEHSVEAELAAPVELSERPVQAVSDVSGGGQVEPTADASANVVAMPLGIAVGVLGVGGLVASWVAYAERQSFRLEPRPELPDEVTQSFRRRGIWMLGLNGMAAVSLVAAEFLLLPEAKEAVPIVAWLTASFGLVTFAIGATYMVTGAQCAPMVVLPGSRIDRVCYSRTADALFGPMLMVSSVPLISVALTYLVRSWVGGSDASVALTGSGLQLRASF